MSYCQLLTAKADGQLTPTKEYRNAYGFLMLIWDFLCEKYREDVVRQWYKTNTRDFAPYPHELPSSLWPWANGPDSKLTTHERNCLVMTYDRAYTQGKENILLFAEALEVVGAQAPKDRVNHLPQIAQDLRTAVAEGAEYVAFYGMSVAENEWAISKEWQDEDGEWEEDYHLLSFTSEADMAEIKHCKWEMNK